MASRTLLLRLNCDLACLYGWLVDDRLRVQRLFSMKTKDGRGTNLCIVFVW